MAINRPTHQFLALRLIESHVCIPLVLSFTAIVNRAKRSFGTNNRTGVSSAERIIETTQLQDAGKAERIV